MVLRAKKPEVKEVKRAKILVSGGPGEGKSFFSLQFPSCYYADAEAGAERGQYQELLQKSGGVYLGREEGANDFGEIIKEVKALSTEKHEYKTFVLDSLSHVYNQEAAEAEMSVGNAFGADKKEANKPTRQLLRWIEKIDMNVVLICHSKADWGNRDKDGQPTTTYDAYEKVAYALDLWIEIKDKKIIVRKSRIDAFQEGMVLSRDYKEFSELFGTDSINRESKAITLATPEEIKNCERLVKGLNMDQKELTKLFKKVDVESFEEMSDNQIESCTKFLSDKIGKLKGD